jgi:protein phosphatase PTC7
VTRRITTNGSKGAFQSGPMRAFATSTSARFPVQTSCRNLSSQVAQAKRACLRAQLPYKFPSAHVRLFHISPSQSSNTKFSYGIAAAFTAKGTGFNPSTNIFNFDPYAPILKKRKDKRTRPASGEDSFFISRVGKSRDVAFGVADGVGGWADSGVDPADFSHAFCDFMAYTASTCLSESDKAAINARSLMQKGYDAIVEDNTVQAGGSTACIGIAKEDGSLEVANLGDSGFVQLRLNAVHNQSEPQTHAFNTPYQLSIIPQYMREKSEAFGGEQLHDMPRNANVTKHSLRHGDVLVFATDGVWDNLSSSDILKVVSPLMVGSRAWEHTEDGIKPGERLTVYTKSGAHDGGTGGMSSLQSFLAFAIAGEAKAASTNTKVDGPFAREVQKYYPGEAWKGGKVDDICCVVAVVVEEGR